jgi:hypothetical protein
MVRVAMLIALMMIVHVIDAFHVAAPRHHENMAIGTNDLDFGTV